MQVSLKTLLQVQKTFMQVRLKTLLQVQNFFASLENIYTSTIENMYASSENIYASSENKNRERKEIIIIDRGRRKDRMEKKNRN